MSSLVVRLGNNLLSTTSGVLPSTFKIGRPRHWSFMEERVRVSNEDDYGYHGKITVPLSRICTSHPSPPLISFPDYRLVDGEGLSTFTALQRQGIPSRLVYFPDENHWVLKPA